jgi:hypothetical protein
MIDAFNVKFLANRGRGFGRKGLEMPRQRASSHVVCLPAMVSIRMRQQPLVQVLHCRETAHDLDRPTAAGLLTRAIRWIQFTAG